jgi:hypothetical protein
MFCDFFVTFLSLKKDVKVSSESRYRNRQKKLLKNYFLLVSVRSLAKRAVSGFVSQRSFLGWPIGLVVPVQKIFVLPWPL